MAWQVEVTDTFGGEANYCWVRRYTIESVPAHIAGDGTNMRRVDRWLLREAKRLAGYTGMRGRTQYNGDMIEWRPVGICHVMFITWQDD